MKKSYQSYFFRSVFIAEFFGSDANLCDSPELEAPRNNVFAT